MFKRTVPVRRRQGVEPGDGGAVPRGAREEARAGDGQKVARRRYRSGLRATEVKI